MSFQEALNEVAGTQLGAYLQSIQSILNKAAAIVVQSRNVDAIHVILAAQGAGTDISERPFFEAQVPTKLTGARFDNIADIADDGGGPDTVTYTVAKWTPGYTTRTVLFTISNTAAIPKGGHAMAAPALAADYTLAIGEHLTIELTHVNAGTAVPNVNISVY
jgi:hypothetical protein